MPDLEEQAVEEEGKSHNDFLTTCQVILYSSPPPLKSALTTLYHLLLGQAPPLPPLASPQKTSPTEEQPTTTIPPTPDAQTISQAQKVTSFARSCGEHTYSCSATSKDHLWEDHPAPRGERSHIGSQHSNLTMLRQFSQDSGMVREARRECFSKHSFELHL